MCVVVPFPSPRRVGYLRKNGELAASYRDPRKYLESLIDKHAQKLVRVGVDRDTAARDVAALRSSLYGYAGVSFCKVGGGDAA